MVAHRTSPTNMGLALLANLSAYDFGYISAGRFIERTANAFRTMEALERHRGHFYNWYDTQSLKPLLPIYISSVDSGNLAGHLLTLRQGLLALPDDKILGARLFDGLSDTLRVLVDAAGGVCSGPACSTSEGPGVSQRDSQPTTLAAARLCLERLDRAGAACSPSELVADLGRGSRAARVNWWARAFVRQCRDALDELTFLAPWTCSCPLRIDSRTFTVSTRSRRCANWPALRRISLPAIEHRLALKVTPEEKRVA